jgi:hypothetical protein
VQHAKTGRLSRSEMCFFRSRDGKSCILSLKHHVRTNEINLPLNPLRFRRFAATRCLCLVALPTEQQSQISGLSRPLLMAPVATMIPCTQLSKTFFVSGFRSSNSGYTHILRLDRLWMIGLDRINAEVFERPAQINKILSTLTLMWIFLINSTYTIGFRILLQLARLSGPTFWRRCRTLGNST